MIPRKYLTSTLLCAALLGVSGLSAAQGASDKAAAEALFDEGVSLLKKGKYLEASQRLESSQRIDPGVGTLLYLGEAYEKLGRTASAWATFREASSQAKAAGQADRAKVGADRADRLMPKLNRVTLDLAPENKSIQGLEIIENGNSVGQALWGTPVPMDPGEHAVEARAPGYKPYKATVTVSGEGQTQSVTIPALEKEPEQAQPAAEKPAEPLLDAKASSSPTEPDAGASDGSVQRAVGLGVTGLGVVGLGLGTFFGLNAISKDNEADDYCNGTSCSDQTGEDLSQDALDSATYSNIAFIAGGVCVVGGLALYFTAPSGSGSEQATALVQTPRLERVGVRPTLAGAALELGGSF